MKNKKRDPLKEIEELRAVCMPVVEYMKKNCTPHNTVVITSEQFKVVADEITFPVNSGDI